MDPPAGDKSLSSSLASAPARLDLPDEQISQLPHRLGAGEFTGQQRQLGHRQRVDGGVQMGQLLVFQGAAAGEEVAGIGRGETVDDDSGEIDIDLAQLADGPITAQYALSEARLLRLGEDAALLSYRADARSPGAEVEEVFYISSLWQRRDGRWWNTFSQDTPGPALTAEEGALRHGPPSARDRSADASPR